MWLVNQRKTLTLSLQSGNGLPFTHSQHDFMKCCWTASKTQPHSPGDKERPQYDGMALFISRCPPSVCIVILLPFSPISRPDSIRSAENLTLTSDWVKKFYTSFGQRYKTQRGEMTASNTVFTVFSGIGIIISIIPLWWHLESWNVGTCMYMIWTALACLVHFVDSIIWNGNVINWAPVWCDICTFGYPFT